MSITLGASLPGHLSTNTEASSWNFSPGESQYYYTRTVSYTSQILHSLPSLFHLQCCIKGEAPSRLGKKLNLK